MHYISLFGHTVLALTLILFSSSALGASRLQARAAYVVKDNHPVPTGWERLVRAAREDTVQLQIGLKSGRFDELERHLHEVSNPRHHRYGLHLTSTEVSELVKPIQQADELVRSWLVGHGIRDFTYSSMRDWISVRIPIHILEDLLNTRYYLWRHVDDGTTVLRASEWSLPMDLHEHIEAVHPTNAFFRSAKRYNDIRPRAQMPSIGLGQQGSPEYEELVKIDRAETGHMEIPNINDLSENPSPSQACNRLATSPLCLRTLYGTLNYQLQAPDKVSIGLVNYLDQINNKSDIEIFLRRYRPDAIGAATRIRTEIVANGLIQQTPVTEEQAARTIGLEGNLNAETVIGLAYPIPVTAYNVGGRAPFSESQYTTENKNEPYLDWLQYILAQPEIPQVITTSYADEEQTVPYWYAKRVCQGFAQLGARGVSVLFASGDDGVGRDGSCVSNDGSNTPMFLPSFPASCPYVTAVGGTRNWDPEIVGFDARRTFVAGGGFSNYFPRPGYQKAPVDSYVSSLGSLHDGLYNKTGRGYPDISLRAYHYITVWNGTARIIDGTSASSPTGAAIFALINDALAAQGKPPLGWLNPWLYSEGFKGLTDIVVGSNPGCNTSGFPAKKGWDAATGLGTPWFPTLKALAEQRQYRATRPWYASK